MYSVSIPFDKHYTQNKKNIPNERKSEQAHIPTLQHCLRMLYTMNGNSKHSDRQSDKKGI